MYTAMLTQDTALRGRRRLGSVPGTAQPARLQPSHSSICLILCQVTTWRISIQQKGLNQISGGSAIKTEVQRTDGGRRPPAGACLSPGPCCPGRTVILSCSVMSNSATPWAVARWAPLSLGFPKQEYWNGLPFPSPGHLPKPGTELISPTFQGVFFTAEPPEKPC